MEGSTQGWKLAVNEAPPDVGATASAKQKIQHAIVLFLYPIHLIFNPVISHLLYPIGLRSGHINWRELQSVEIVHTCACCYWSKRTGG
ncbi:MAG: hypothetical protein ACR2OL_11300 [Anderseniella sp.]